MKPSQRGKKMSTKTHLINSVKWVLYAFLLFLIVDYISDKFPEFRVHRLAILGAFVIYAAYRLRKRAKLVRTKSP